MRRYLLTCLFALLTVPASATTSSEPEPEAVHGYVVAIGGALRNDNDEVWKRVVALAGGPGAKFVVLGTASEHPQASAEGVARLLTRRGAVAEALPVGKGFEGMAVEQAVQDPALIARVRAARGVFFPGGSQERIVDALQPGGRRTPLLEAIWQLYRDGGVVAGSSAGAAIMSRAMFRDAPNVIDVMKGKWSEGKQVDLGLGFVGPDLFVDQHFLRRGRVGRMIPLMLAKGYRLGLGVDENTAAVIHGDDIEIIGGSGALLVDLGDSQTTPGLPFNVRGARLSFLDHGDRYQLRSRTATPSAAKLRGEVLAPGTPGFEPYYTEDRFDLDVLGNATLLSAMAQLVDSAKPEVQGLAFDARVKAGEPLADLGFLFRLYKAADTKGWGSTEMGIEEYTVLDVRLDVTPVKLATPLFKPWN